MSALLGKYVKALRARNYTLACNIEREFIEELKKESFDYRDIWMEKLTKVSI